MTGIACSSNSLMFDGIFAGMEGKLRITKDKKWVSVIDVISVVGGQNQPRKTWVDIKKEGNLCVTFCNAKTFPGKGNSNVECVNAEGLVHLINRIPGKNADAFRFHEAKILVRYLGGDLSLIDEIKAIDQLHTENPENPAQIFRQDPIVQQNLLRFVNLDVEKERTKRTEIEYITKQLEIEHVTKQKQLEIQTKQLEIEHGSKQLEIDKLKLEFEIMKWKQENKVAAKDVKIENEVNNEVEQWVKENIEFKSDEILELTDLNLRRFGPDFTNRQAKGRFRKEVEKVLQKLGTDVPDFNHLMTETGGSKKFKGIKLI